jgi:hypothetical protein
MKYVFQIDDVFSSTLFGRNQLEVLPDAVGTTFDDGQLHAAG